MRLTRRHFLAATALVAGAGAVTGATAYRWWDQDPAEPYRVLSADEVRFLDALAEAMFPAGGTPPLGGREAGVARYVDLVIGGMHPTQGKLVRLSLHALDALPVASHGARFSTLALADAQAQVAEWTAHPVFEIRALFQSFYIFVAMAYLAHPKVSPLISPSFNCGFGE